MVKPTLSSVKTNSILHDVFVFPAGIPEEELTTQRKDHREKIQEEYQQKVNCGSLWVIYLLINYQSIFKR